MARREVSRATRAPIRKIFTVKRETGNGKSGANWYKKRAARMSRRPNHTKIGFPFVSPLTCAERVAVFVCVSHRLFRVQFAFLLCLPT
jgi:hypothetical protein